ncbi:MAG: hypothetical protein C5B53_08075 [Candidatus Melainabacteria bacterium]|nr:MAG: hypothetical protein C5B53_08075 [Candidatus Melainabacteria bacterium]
MYDGGLTDEKQPYLVMEFAEGKTLSSLIAEEGQLLREATSINDRTSTPSAAPFMRPLLRSASYRRQPDLHFIETRIY